MRKAARVDTTSRDLRAYAESIGFSVVVLNGVVDCLLVWSWVIFVCDWKSKNGTLTPDQIKLVAKGVPVHFVSQPEQLDALKAEALWRIGSGGSVRPVSSGTNRP